MLVVSLKIHFCVPCCVVVLLLMLIVFLELFLSCLLYGWHTWSKLMGARGNTHPSLNLGKMKFREFWSQSICIQWKVKFHVISKEKLPLGCFKNPAGKPSFSWEVTVCTLFSVGCFTSSTMHCCCKTSNWSGVTDS